MKVTAEVKIQKLEQALRKLAPYRDHYEFCEVGMTDFCTCGMREASVMAQAAISMEVEVPVEK